MTELHVVTSFVFPGGVVERDVGGKRRLVRVCLGMIDCDERGLLAELEGKIDPIPWLDNNARTQAIQAIQDAEWIDAGLTAKLVRHVTLSKYFEVRG